MEDEFVKKTKVILIMSISKLLSLLLFCLYLIVFLIDSSLIPGLLIIYAFFGLALIYIGQGIGPIRLRKYYIPVCLEFTGWILLLRPIVHYLFY